TNSLIDICEEENMPYQREVCGSSTGTNADVISVTKSGVRTALISIPLLNMHTAAETISMSDVENTAKLIADYVRKAVK
ncbi:MAG: M42 family peptidase, partial [Clostridia bacterium]|nr:M42 family peptidase [Clostridia bacterium]